MKGRVYLRIAKDKGHLKFASSTKPKHDALKSGSLNNEKVLPTILIALDVDVPDREFDATRILLETNVETYEPAVQVRQINDEVENGDNQTN